jgi:hypothetical protein
VESAFILKLDFMSKAVFFIFFSHEQNSNSADNVLKNNILCNFSFIFLQFILFNHKNNNHFKLKPFNKTENVIEFSKTFSVYALENK